MSAFEDLFDDAPQVTVSQYTASVRKALEGTIPTAWVSGEISNLRRQASGHIYFSLKDAGAQLPAVMFRMQASRLEFAPQDGMQVLAQGDISVYEPYGRYQLVVSKLRQSGEGRLYREFERLKQKLSAEGLFDAARKKALPGLALRVGIVTSPTGAALQDFLQIMQRRHWGGSIKVLPVKVQGAEATREIVAAIDWANEWGRFDVLVVCRGGGSIEDLWCFNEEAVARAVAASSIPVISAVGHEIDFTLSDFAADVRAETPSAAAEILSSSFAASLERVAMLAAGMETCAVDALKDARVQLREAGHRLKSVSPELKLQRSHLRIDALSVRFHEAFRRRVQLLRERWGEAQSALRDCEVRSVAARHRERLSRLAERLERAVARQLEARRHRLQVLQATQRALGPEATVKRGFAVVRDAEGAVVSSAAAAAARSALELQLRDGRVRVRVDETKP